MKAAPTRTGNRHPYRLEQILQVAVDLFHRHGIANTNVEEIAREVGIRPSSLYHHFRDKQAIVDAAVDLANADLVSRLQRATKEKPDPRVRLEALIGELVDHVVGNLPLAAVGRHDRALASAPSRRRADQVETHLLDALTSLIGAVRPKLAGGERRALAHGLVGVVWSVTHSDLHLGPPALAEHLRAASRAVVLGSERARRGTKRAGRQRKSIDARRRRAQRTRKPA